MSQPYVEKQGEVQEQEVDEVWNDPAADIVLVSSDNVAFRVPGYHLISQSVVLRDALQINSTLPTSTPPSSSSPLTIHLTDEDCETSESLRLFLHLISTGDLTSFIATHQRTIVRALLSTILFLQKYDCAPALALLSAWLGKHAALHAHESREVSALDVWMIAAKTGNEALAVDVVKHYRPRVMKAKAGGEGEGADGSRDEREIVVEGYDDGMVDERWCWGAYTGLDPGDFPIMAWEACPQMWLWALSKAVKSSDDWAKRGEVLEGILDETKFLR
ncbi:hypothetical protein IAT38_003121 [Cryptococcus sp. DSM 104549]